MVSDFTQLPVNLNGKVSSTEVPAGLYVVSEASVTIGKLDADRFWSPWVDDGTAFDTGIFAGTWDGLAAVGFRAAEVRQPFAETFFTPLNGLVAVVSLELLDSQGFQRGPVDDGEVNIGGGYFPVVEFLEPTTVSRAQSSRGKLEIRVGELIVEGKD